MAQVAVGIAVGLRLIRGLVALGRALSSPAGREVITRIASRAGSFTSATSGTASFLSAGSGGAAVGAAGTGGAAAAAGGFAILAAGGLGALVIKYGPGVALSIFTSWLYDQIKSLFEKLQVTC